MKGPGPFGWRCAECGRWWSFQCFRGWGKDATLSRVGKTSFIVSGSVSARGAAAGAPSFLSTLPFLPLANTQLNHIQHSPHLGTWNLSSKGHQERQC